MKTFAGPCCAFNYHADSNRISDTYTLNQYGKFGGLSILFTGRGTTNTGLFLRLHSPNEDISRLTESTAVYPGYENFLKVFRQFRGTTSNFLTMSLKTRKCYLPRDLELAEQSQSRCLDECQIRNMHQICGCHPCFKRFVENYLPIRNCNVSDVHCFVHHDGKK